jgi:hypothetical protein
MRAGLALSLVLALAAASPALAGQPIPPEAQGGIDAVKAMLKSDKSASFRKIKVSPAGDVCAMVSPSAGSDDIAFTWTKVTGEVWINESPQNGYSEFVWGNPSLKRSTERADYQAWKACQKG